MGFICQSCSIEQQSWSGSCPNCGSKRALQIETEDPMIGRTVAGKYKILRKLGQGGVGAVFEGELEGIGQRVALKFLNKSFQMDSKTALRFLNEAKGLARLSHPNTVSLHDFGQDEEGHFFISMEFVEGEDLRKYLGEKGRLPPPDAVEVTLQVADALGDAHLKGLVHRDVKPENIMVRRRARGLFIKVLDFGLARLVEEGTSRLTNAGTLMGSLRYISPEQASGTEVDGRTDIYSLGIVLYEMLTGVQPFLAPIEVDILRKHKEMPMPHLWEAVGELQLPELDAVIQRATAKDPNARYPTMEEFSVALSATTTARAPQMASGRIDSSHPAPAVSAYSRSVPSRAEQPASTSFPSGSGSDSRNGSASPSREASSVSGRGLPATGVPATAGGSFNAWAQPSVAPTESALPVAPSWAKRNMLWLALGGGASLIALVAAIVFWPHATPPAAKPASTSAQIAPPSVPPPPSVQPTPPAPAPTTPPVAQAPPPAPAAAPPSPPSPASIDAPAPAPTQAATTPSASPQSPKPVKKKAPVATHTQPQAAPKKPAAQEHPVPNHIVDPFAQ